MKLLRAGIVIWGVLLLLPDHAHPGELLMLEQAGCVWCAQFDQEIAPAWPKTEEGRRAPLRRIDINNEWPAELDHIKRDRMTPTFILLHEGEEVGRLRGYVGDEFFWYRIGELIDLLLMEETARGRDE